jgi:para-nitrobenzyl esterase
MRSFLGLLLAACAAEPASQMEAIAANPVVDVPTESGLAHGVVDGGMRAFRGLYYAAAPVGDLRWRDPQPPPACAGGVCDATAFGPLCLQVKFGGQIAGAEDCLTLNVFTPLDAGGDAGLPVLVFVHGGGLDRGSAHNQVPIAPPIVVDERVVVVTIEYRLNVFGGLAHRLLTAESGGSADYYLLDTIAALEWLQRNIGAFGGDRDHVMVFGQSAGASVVGMLLAARQARGLFASAGMESGPLGEGQPLPSLEDCEPIGDAIAAAVGCDAVPDVLACLRAAPALDLLAAYRAVPAGTAPGCVDVALDGRLVAEQPLEIVKREGTVPLLIGENSNESGLPPDAAVSGDDYVAFVHSLLDPFGAEAVDKALRLYPLADYPTPAAAESGFYNDFEFARGDRTWALAAARDQGVAWKYFFTHGLENAPDLAGAGAYHTLELAFVFGTITAGVDQNGSPYAPTAAEIELAHDMEGLWARFAAHGDPNGDGPPRWPRFERGLERYLQIDDTSAAGARYHTHQLQFLARFNSHA